MRGAVPEDHSAERLAGEGGLGEEENLAEAAFLRSGMAFCGIAEGKHAVNGDDEAMGEDILRDLD